MMISQCWCGNTDLLPFSAHYLRCPACETLITAQMPNPEFTMVKEDDRDFYGREYWFSHQEQDLGFVNITQRARADLPERCLHWLKALLKYKLPPGKTLEMGCAHGGFVALMRWAGFEATGLELSPWVVDFARRTFDIPMLLGPIEEQQVEPESLDVIALMDVLEHLPDPLGTMRHCLELLKPDGILLIQTPRYAEGRTYEDMVAQDAPFLAQLKHEQHLYLLSQSSIRELFRRLGAEHLAFEPAIFEHYDMFAVVSREPLQPTTSQESEQQLIASIGGRMVLALLDLGSQIRGAQVKYAELESLYGAVEADRAARLEVIERQGAELGRLSSMLSNVDHLQAQLAAAEADRAARLEVIERQGAELGRIPELQAQLDAAEADRAARLEVIERQGAELGQLRQRFMQVEQQVRAIRHLFYKTRIGTILRLMRPGWWRRFETTMIEATALSHLNGSQKLGSVQNATYEIKDYIAEIDHVNRAQPNADLLDSIRSYNHRMVDELNKLRSLRGKRLLDIGASPHGYALERTLQCNAAEYVGIGLDVKKPIEVHAANGVGRLLAMDATHLDFEDASFDLVISLSTFEHIDDVAAALREIKRVLKPAGSALISFEPIWTCSYGHHLHHFGPVAKFMPDWAHLLWDQQQMLRELAPIWPADATLTLDEAAHWVYESAAINRIGIAQMREFFAHCGLEVDWIAPIPDGPRDPSRLREVAAAVSLSPDDLMVKGLSVLLNKAIEPISTVSEDAHSSA